MRTQPLQRNQSRNGTTRFLLGAGSIACGIAVLAISGCTTYVGSPPPRTVYVSPLPPPLPPPPPAPAVPPANVTAYVAPSTTVAVSADASVEVIHSDSDFYQPLSPYGDWIVVGSYGRCWRPARVDAGWRPYANGHWEMTDAGWYWVSDEPWAWATYHYGRWDWNARFGWFWVPQTQWAPAWVAWREGGGYIGWAPLPPSAMIAVGGSVQFHEASLQPRSFVFVQQRHLLEPVRPATVVVNNTTVINKTVNITKIRVVNKTVINDGPRADIIERESGRKLKPMAARELRHREETVAVARHRQFQAHEELKPRAPETPGGSRPSQDRIAHSVPATDRTFESRNETRPTPPPTRPVEVRETRPAVPATRIQPQRNPREQTPARVESPRPKPEPTPVVRRPEVKEEQRPAPLPRATVPSVRPVEATRPARSTETPARVHRPAETPVSTTTARPETTRSPRHSQQTEVRRSERTATANESRAASARQTTRQLRSPKDKSAARPTAAQNTRERQRRGKQDSSEKNRKPVTPLPPP